MSSDTCNSLKPNTDTNSTRELYVLKDKRLESGLASHTFPPAL